MDQITGRKIKLPARILKRFKKRKYFMMLLLSMLGSVLLTTFFFGISNYIIFKNSSVSITLESKRTMVEVMISNLDIIFRDIEKQLSVFSLQSPIKELRNDDINNKSENYFQLVKELTDLSFYSTYIHSVYLYDEEFQTVFTSREGWYELEEFYDSSWIETARSIRNWTRSRSVTTLDGLNTRVFSLIKEVSIGDEQNDPDMFLCVNFHVAKINDFFISHIDEGYESISISNNDSELITQIGTLGAELQAPNEISGDESNYFAFRYESNFNKWNVVYKGYNLKIIEPISRFGIGMIIIGLSSIIFGFFLSFYLTKRAYKPISTVTHKLYEFLSRYDSEQYGSISEDDDIIAESFDRITEINQRVFSRINNMNTLIEESMMGKLLSGAITNELFSEDRKMDLVDNYDFFTVAIFNIDKQVLTIQDNASSSVSLLSSVKDIIGKISNDSFKGITVLLGPEKIGLVICGLDEGNSETSIRDVLDRIKEKIRDRLHVSVTIGVSSNCTNPEELFKKYDEAISASKYRFLSGNSSINYYKDVAVIESKSVAHYPNLMDEEVFRRNIRNKGLENISLYIKEFLLDKPISIDHFFPKYYRAVNIILEEFNNEYRNMSDKESLVQALMGPVVYQTQSVDDLIDIMTTNLNQFLTSPEEQEKTLQYKIVKEIVDFIDSHFNEEISLHQLSVHLSLSESYVSRLFKKEMKVNFVEYVARFRLSKAEEYLAKTNYTLEDIADRVALTNSQNLIRLFKKYYGITPGKFREKFRSFKL